MLNVIVYIALLAFPAEEPARWVCSPSGAGQVTVCENPQTGETVDGNGVYKR